MEATSRGYARPRPTIAVRRSESDHRPRAALSESEVAGTYSPSILFSFVLRSANRGSQNCAQRVADSQACLRRKAGAFCVDEPEIVRHHASVFMPRAEHSRFRTSLLARCDLPAAAPSLTPRRHCRRLSSALLSFLIAVWSSCVWFHSEVSSFRRASARFVRSSLLSELRRTWEHRKHALLVSLCLFYLFLCAEDLFAVALSFGGRGAGAVVRGVFSCVFFFPPPSRCESLAPSRVVLASSSFARGGIGSS